jgi:hypothetical protein
MSKALAYVKSVTHDLIRHGTLTLFAALDPLVLGRASERRLLVHPQACQSPLPAGPAATLPYALHTYLGPWLNQVERRLNPGEAAAALLPNLHNGTQISFLNQLPVSCKCD